MSPKDKLYYYFKHFVHKLTHWEYWPQEIVYLITYPYYAWIAFRLKAAGFFVLANPHNGELDFLMESKYKIYQHIPNEYYPLTIYIRPSDLFKGILIQMNEKNICFPCIAKPDIGQKGIGVKKIMNASELEKYHLICKHPYLIQELIEYPHEAGIFYVRYPNNNNGKITGIVYKEYLHIIGNGNSTIEELIYSTARTYFQLHYLKDKFSEQWNDILPLGEKLIVVPFGSHFRGSKFLDYSHMISPRLEESINQVCSKINGYHYGRMDIKFDNWVHLEQGKKFKIIETNGAGSEPTHMYDPKHSIIFAWKEIFRHLSYLYEVCRQNKEKGYKCANLIELSKMYKRYRVYMKDIA